MDIFRLSSFLFDAHVIPQNSPSHLIKLQKFRLVYITPAPREPNLPALKIERCLPIQLTPWTSPSVVREMQALLLSHPEADRFTRGWNLRTLILEYFYGSFFLGLVKSLALRFCYRTLDYCTYPQGKLEKYTFYCYTYSQSWNLLPSAFAETIGEHLTLIITLFAVLNLRPKPGLSDCSSALSDIPLSCRASLHIQATQQFNTKIRRTGNSDTNVSETLWFTSPRNLTDLAITQPADFTTPHGNVWWLCKMPLYPSWWLDWNSLYNCLEVKFSNLSHAFKKYCSVNQPPDSFHPYCLHWCSCSHLMGLQ